MRATYIDHSGFFIEGEEHCLLFDYYRGSLPQISGKALTCFASHHHPDHYTAEMFVYGEQIPDTKYMLGCDITLNSINRQRMGISDATFARCVRLHRDDVREDRGVRIQALRSTDLGVAFYVECEGKHIYHAGDHNLWIWHEDASFDKSQVEKFYFEIEKLRGKPVDAAFLPLDPRLGDEYWRGFDAFVRLIEPKRVFPMHMVDDYGIIQRLKALPCARPYRDRIVEIQRCGDGFFI